MMQVTGLIKAISRQETMVSQNGTQFTKQSVFLDNGRYDQDTGERHDNDLLLDFINLKDGDIAQRFRKGDKVTISFRLRGRSWKSKADPNKTEWGVGVSCYRIEPFQGGHNAQPQSQPTAQPQQPPQQQAAEATDLPF